MEYHDQSHVAGHLTEKLNSMKKIIQHLFEKVDDAIRHHKKLGDFPWLRNLLRRPYHVLMALNRSGYSLCLGGCVTVKVPPEFNSKLMEQYEREEFQELAQWCSKSNSGLFVDVGCSLGYISCAAMFSNMVIEVLAIDSDLNSLQTAGRVCWFASGRERLHRVQALVVSSSSRPVGWKEAEWHTEIALRQSGVTGDPNTHRYINLDHPESATIPRYALDDLLKDEIIAGTSMLVKCDVEGAELEVLKGAHELMTKNRCLILLSVHPIKLTNMGHNQAMVEEWLEKCGYSYRQISADHELHWMCTAKPNWAPNYS